jgi:hypothetical protein
MEQAVQSQAIATNCRKRVPSGNKPAIMQACPFENCMRLSPDAAFVRFPLNKELLICMTLR